MHNADHWSETDEREIWLRGLNSRNIEEEGEDSSKWDFAIVFVCLRVLEKFSPWEQKKFHKCDLKLCFGEDTDENWLWSEDVCHFFGVDHPEDIKKVESLMVDDELVNAYSSLFIKK